MDCTAYIKNFNNMHIGRQLFGDGGSNRHKMHSTNRPIIKLGASSTSNLINKSNSNIESAAKVLHITHPSNCDGWNRHPRFHKGACFVVSHQV